MEQIQEIKSNKKAVRTLSAGHFIIDNFSAFSTPILPLIAVKLGTNMAILASILSIGHLCSSIFQPVFGYVADRWRKRFFLVFGLLLGSMFNSLIGIAPNLWSLALCVALGSLGTGFFHPQATSMMVIFSEKSETVKDMGLFLASGTLGYSIGPLVSSSIANFAGLEFLPLVSIFGLICLFFILKFVPKISNIQVQEEKPEFFKSMKVILKDRIIQILLMISSLKSMTSIIFTVFMPFYWTEQGFTTFQIGIIIFIFLSVSAMGTYSSAIFERKFGTIKTFAISMFSTLPLAICYFLLAPKFPVMALIFYILIGYFMMLSVSINMILAQKHLPQYKSIIAGFIGGFSWGVVGVLLGLLGYIAEKIGVEKLLIILSIIPFICTYFLKFLPKEEVVNVD